jgi:hypothetical protein
MGSKEAFAFSTAITQAARMKLTPSWTSPIPRRRDEREKGGECEKGKMNEREREESGMRGEREKDGMRGTAGEGLRGRKSEKRNAVLQQR